MTKQMTAVEWLVEELTKNGHNFKLYKKEIEQAKEMEKKQIMDAVEWGNRRGYDDHTLTCIYDEDLKYYNETFKKE